MKTRLLMTLAAVVILCCIAGPAAFCQDGTGPLGEWPDFEPIGYITAPHPDDPQYQTYLYGDWGAIVGEEFIFLQDGMIKLLYHSYHATYLTERVHELEILDNWALGYDAETKIKFTPLAQPGGPYPGPAWEHTDTPAYIQHPITGEHLIYNTVRPGTKYLHPEWEGLPGHETAIQVATSDSPPAIGVPFEQTYENMLVAELWWEQGWNNDGVIKGGLSEPTAVWVPHLGPKGMVRLFYRGLNGSPSSYWNWRISYADSYDGRTEWVKNETPTFDPSDPDNPAYRWTQPPPIGFNFRGSWQAHCTGDERANGVHMILCVSNQNYALGGRLAYYWSPDWGDTWIGHPDNPIIVAGTHPDGVPATGFQRTPTLLIDEEYGRYIIAYNAGHDISEPARRRTHLAVASRPGVDPSGAGLPESTAHRLQLRSLDPNPSAGGSASLQLELPGSGRLQLRVFAVDGRLVRVLVDAELSAGRHAVSWDKTASDGTQVHPGVYLVRGSFEARRLGASKASCRIVVLE